MSFSDIIEQGRKDEKSKKPKKVNTKSSKEVNNDVGKKVNTDKGKTRDNEPVNITIKVPRKARQYWTSQCKLEGVTMTQVIVEALEKKFGEPE